MGAGGVVRLHPALTATGVDDRAGEALGPVAGARGAQQPQAAGRAPDLLEALLAQRAGVERRVTGRDHAGVHLAVGVDREVAAAGGAEVVAGADPPAPAGEVVDDDADLGGRGEEPAHRRQQLLAGRDEVGGSSRRPGGA